MAKRLTTLLRHGQLPRQEDGAIEFWRLKDHLRNALENSQHWSDEMWKSRMQGGGGNKKYFKNVLTRQDKKFFISELFKVFGRNPIDPSLQDNVFVQSNFFEYIYHFGCAINLHPSQIQD